MQFYSFFQVRQEMVVSILKEQLSLVFAHLPQQPGYTTHGLYTRSSENHLFLQQPRFLHLQQLSPSREGYVSPPAYPQQGELSSSTCSHPAERANFPTHSYQSKIRGLVNPINTASPRSLRALSKPGQKNTEHDSLLSCDRNPSRHIYACVLQWL